MWGGPPGCVLKFEFQNNQVIDFGAVGVEISLLPLIRIIAYGAVKCRLIWHFRGQALLLRIACDNVRDCVFLKDDLNRVKKGLNSKIKLIRVKIFVTN